jgi:Rrf2 family iron-sulfur cluster assembly transcriptional regulator
LAEVAQRQKISLSYLEQLVAKLKRHALARAMRGPGGGYLLGQPPDAITIYQIVSAVDTSSHREPPMFEGDNQTARQLTDRLWLKMARKSINSSNPSLLRTLSSARADRFPYP